MHALFLLPLAASGVCGLVFPRQDTCAIDSCQQALQSVATASSDCAAFMDATTTKTSGYTFVTGINSEVTYSTSVVTAFALSTTSAAAAEKRQATSSPGSVDSCPDSATADAANSTTVSAMPTYASACGNASSYSSACQCAYSLAPTTKTVEVFTATATATSTYTFSEVAQATQTLAACDAGANYGYFQGTIEWNSEFDGDDTGFPVGQPHPLIYPNSTMAGCCLLCYQLDTAGCLQYEFTPANSTCTLTVNDGACPQTPEQRLQVILYPNDEKPMVGVGTCDVEVQGFDG